jgi:glycosyltransferase involved in cell wall biosynthesis
LSRRSAPVSTTRCRQGLLIQDDWSGCIRMPGVRPEARDLAGRSSPNVPASKVVSFTGRTLWDALTERRSRSLEERYQRYLDKGRAFALAINRHLEPRLRNADRLAYFAFDTGCLETIRLLSRHGVPTVVDQIDPARVEEQVVLEEINRWPGWERSPGRIPERYFERLEAEWRESDVVLVNSEWCATALTHQGVPSEKIAIAPIAFGSDCDVLSEASRDEASNVGRPLRVLWLGQVNLRKGIPYLFEAARLLAGSAIEFRVVGPVSISEAARREAPANVRIEGPVARVDAARAYEWADVFVLPTLSDGFAITQLEAMAHGLPVITTPNCGEVVTDGEEGLVVPIRDAEALARAIARLAQDRELLHEMSRNASRKVREFSMQRVAQRRLDAICDVFERTACAV